MLSAPTLANTLQPCINTLVVEVDIIVGGGFEFIRVKYLDDSSLPSCSDRSFSCVASIEDLDMDHVMFLRFPRGVIIGGSIEHKVAWLHVLFLQIDG